MDNNENNEKTMDSTHSNAGVEVITPTDHNWGAMAHLLTFVGFIIPFGNLLAPFVVYLVKKDESSFIKDQAIEALNFQITVTIAYLVCILAIFTIIGIPFAVLGFLVLCVGDIVLTIIAAIKASDGERYRYPFAIRLIS